MDKIFIKDLVVYGVIGVHEWERQKPREIILNIVIFVDLQESGTSDDILDTIDYGMVVEKVKTCVENAERKTIEALAADIADVCLDIPKVLSVRVNLEKPGAIQNVGSVGVEIERSWKE
jgi:FolB domain-containing protein